jgi:hypothetical protein
MGRLTDHELERIWEEEVFTQSRYFPNIFLEVLRKTTKIRIHDSHVLAKVQTEHLLNTRLELYRYASRLNHREGGKCKVCRNMRKTSTFDEASL